MATTPNNTVNTIDSTWNVPRTTEVAQMPSMINNTWDVKPKKTGQNDVQTYMPDANLTQQFIDTIQPYVSLSQEEKDYLLNESGRIASNGGDVQSWVSEFLTVNAVANALNVSREDVYNNKDTLLNYYLGIEAPKWEMSTGYSLINSYNQGKRQQELAGLQEDLLTLFKNGYADDSEKVKFQTELINKKLQEIEQYKDYTPHAWYVDWANSSVSQIAYMMEGTGAGMVGSLLGGTAASLVAGPEAFGVGAKWGGDIARILTYRKQFEAQAFWNMKQACVSTETALRFSNYDGLVNALNEALLDVGYAQIMGGVGSVFGIKDLAGNLVPNIIDAATKNGLIPSIAAKFLVYMGTDASGEFIQESTQSLTSFLFQRLAESTDNLPASVSGRQALRDAISEGVQGFLTGLFFGGMNGIVSVGKDWTSTTYLKNQSEKTLSKDTFVNDKYNREVVQNLRLGGELLSEEQITETLSNLYDSTSKARNELRNSVLSTISEDMNADEDTWNYYANGAQIVEGPVYDEAGNDISKKGTQVMEMPDGSLFFVEDVKKNDDGTETRTMRIGNPNVVGRSALFEDVLGAETAGANTGSFRQYTGSNASAVMEQAGSVTFTIDNNNGTITINSVEVQNNDKSLMDKAVRQMASMYVDYDLKWNPTDETGKAVLSDIATSNPRGEQFGLNYIERTFDTKDKAEVERWLGDNFSRVASERSLMAMILQSAAKGMNMSGMDFINKYMNDIQKAKASDFEANVRGQWKATGKTGTDEEFKADVQAQMAGAKAYVKTQEINGQVKATIYAGEHGDPTSFLHELHHTIMLIGDNMESFTDLFDKVKDSDQFKAFVKRNLDIISQVRQKDENGRFIRDSHGNYQLDEQKLASLFKNRDQWTRTDFEFEASLYEAWDRNGQTLNPQLKGIFQRVGEIFRSVYRSMRNGFGGVDLNAEIKDFFDSKYGYDKDGSNAQKDYSNAKLRNIGSLLEQQENFTEEEKKNHSKFVFEGGFDELVRWSHSVTPVIYDGTRIAPGIYGNNLPRNKEIGASKISQLVFGGNPLVLPSMISVYEEGDIQKNPDAVNAVNGDRFIEFKRTRSKDGKANIVTIASNISDGFKKANDVVLVSFEKLDENSIDDVFEALNGFKSTYIKNDSYRVVFLSQPDSGLFLYDVKKETEKTVSYKGQRLNVDETSRSRYDQLQNIINKYFVNQKDEDSRIDAEKYRNAPEEALLSQTQDSTVESMSAQDQYNYIKNKYEGTDKYMMAPNGKATNLTERQWIQVRTPNFIRWFGDWINDPANASKVVDENGEPRVVFHGSPNKFDIFDRSRIGETTDDGWFGRGFYFTDDNERAEFFSDYDFFNEVPGGQIVSAFLNIRKPLDISELADKTKWDGSDSLMTTYWYNLAEALPYDLLDRELYGSVEDEYGEKEDTVWSLRKYHDLVDQKHAEGSVTPFKDAAEELFTNYKDVRNDVFDFDGTWNGNGPSSVFMANEITALYERGIIDGVIYAGGYGDETVVFSANQIKSATDNNGEFSLDEDSILRQDEENDATEEDWLSEEEFRRLKNTPSFGPDGRPAYNKIGQLRYQDVASYMIKKYGLEDDGAYYTFHCKPENFDARITKPSVGKLVSKPAALKSVANGFSLSEHNEIVMNSEELFFHAQLLTTGPDNKGSGNINSIDRFATVFKFDGDKDLSTAYFTVKGYGSHADNRLYSVELKELKKTPSINGVASTDVVVLHHTWGYKKNTTSNEKVNSEDPVNGGTALTQKVDDQEIIDRFNNASPDEYIIAHRSMQLVDGKLYPPMAAVIRGQRQDGLVPGDIVKADENPDLAKPDMGKDGKQKVNKNTGRPVYKFALKKGGYETYPDGTPILYKDEKTGKMKPKKLGDVPADYDPYIHSTLSYLNDQFSSAYKRSNLVTVEVKLLKSDLDSGYWADKASLPVGEHAWKTGAVSSALKDYGVERNLFLSQYAQIVRVIPDSEVADNIAELLSDKPDVVIPDNTVTPSLLSELKARGVNLSESEEVKLLNEWYERQKENENSSMLMQAAYHGSPYWIEDGKLSTKYIGSGEGAQVHGWGLYVTKNYDIANDRYRERLLGRKHPEFSIKENGVEVSEDERKVIERNLHVYSLTNKDENREYAEGIIDYLKNGDVGVIHTLDVLENAYNTLMNNPKMSAKAFLEGAPKGEEHRYELILASARTFAKINGERVNSTYILTEVSKMMAPFKRIRESQLSDAAVLESIDWDNLVSKEKKGTLITVDIPEDNELLDEQKPVAFQSPEVRTVLASIWNTIYGRELETDVEKIKSMVEGKHNAGTLSDKNYDYFQRMLNGETHEYWFDSFSNEMSYDQVHMLDMFLFSGRDVYKALDNHFSLKKYSTGERSDKAASLYLDSLGIKGITYDGRTDGRCFVIFNDDSINTVDTMLLQSIGETGAYEYGPIATEKKELAMKMEAEGKGPREIKFATGWEKDPNGNWYYDVLDGELKDDFSFHPQTDENGKTYYRLEDLYVAPEVYKAYPKFKDFKVYIDDDYILNNPGTRGYYNMNGVIGLASDDNFKSSKTDLMQTLRAERDSTKAMQDYHSKASEYMSKWQHGELRSKDFSDAMRNLRAELFADPEYSELNARIDELDKAPSYLVPNRRELYPTIIHEIQHAIQEEEGYPNGGNTELKRRVAAITASKYIENLDRTQRIISDLIKQKTLLKEYYNAWLQGLEWGDENNPPAEVKTAENLYFWDDKVHWNKGFADRMMDTLDHIQKSIDHFEKNEAELGASREWIENIEKMDDFDFYQRILGELNARAVASLRGASEELRRKTLLSDMYDKRDGDIFVLSEWDNSARRISMDSFLSGERKDQNILLQLGDDAWVQTAKEIIAQNPYDIDAFYDAYAKQVADGNTEINDSTARKMLKELFNEESSKISQEDWDNYWNTHDNFTSSEDYPEEEGMSDDFFDVVEDETSPAEDYPEATEYSEDDLPDWMRDDYEPDVQAQEEQQTVVEETKSAMSDIQMVMAEPAQTGAKHSLDNPNGFNQSAESRAQEFGQLLRGSKEDTVKFLQALRDVNDIFYAHNDSKLWFDPNDGTEESAELYARMATANDDLQDNVSQFIRNLVFQTKNSTNADLSKISDRAWHIVAGQVSANPELYMDLYSRATGDANWAYDSDLETRVKTELGMENANVSKMTFAERQRLANQISDKDLRNRIMHGGDVSNDELKAYIRRQEALADAERKKLEAINAASEADNVEKGKQIRILSNRGKQLQDDLNKTTAELDDVTDRLEKEVRSLENRAKRRGLTTTDTQVQSELKKKQNQLQRKQKQLQTFREKLKNEGGWNKQANIDKENEIRDAIKKAEDAINALQKQDIITSEEAIKRIDDLYRSIANDRIAKAVKDTKQIYQDRQKEIREVRRIMEEKKRMARQIMKAPSANVNLDEAEQIVAIQQAIDPNFRRGLIVDGVYTKVADLKAKLKADPNDPSLSMLTERQYDIISRKSLDEMTLGEVEGIYNTVKSLRKQGLDKRMAYLSAVATRNRNIQMELQSIVMDNPDYQPEAVKGSEEERKRFSSAKSKYRTAKLATYNMARKAQMMDGDRKGLFYDLLLRKKRELASMELTEQKKRMGMIEDVMKASGLKADDLYAMYQVELDNWKAKLSVSQLGYVYLSKNNERNRAALAYGTFVGDREKQVIMNGAKASIIGDTAEAKKARDKKANDDIAKIGDRRWQAVYDVAKEVIEGTPGLLDTIKAIEADFNSTGFQRVVDLMRKVFNEEVVRESYYLPINRKGYVAVSPADAVNNDISNAIPGRFKASVEQGFKHSRIDMTPYHQQEVDYDLFRVWRESVQDQEHTLANLEYVRQLNAIFEGRGNDTNTLRSAIEDTFGKAMMDAIDNHIKEIADPNAGSLGKHESDAFFKMAKGNVYSAYLGFKLSAVTNQLITSPAAFLGKVGPVRLASKMLEMMVSWGKVTDKVYGLSSFMKNRTYDIIAGEIQEAASNAGIKKGTRLWNQLLDTGLKGLEWVDEYCVTAGWLAIYEQEIERLGGLETDENMAKAVQIADEYVMETQPLSDKTELAPLFKNKPEAANLLLQFQSSLNVIWNNVTYDVPKAFKNHQYRLALGTIFGYTAAGALLALAHGDLKGKDDDKNKGFMFIRRLIFASTTQFLDGTPLVSSYLEDVVKLAITGEKPQFGNKSDPFAAVAKDVQAVEKLIESMYDRDPEDFEKALQYTLEAVELNTGLPYSGIKELKKIPEVGLQAVLGAR